MAHTVTPADFDTSRDDLYYTGPLAEAKAFIQRHHGTTEHVIDTPHGSTVEVLVGYGTDAPTAADAAEWGRGAGPEEAWRYALGAVFGPLDEEFHDVELTDCEACTAEPFPVGAQVEILCGGQWTGPYTVTDGDGRSPEHLVLRGHVGVFEHHNDAPYNLRRI